MLSKSHSDSSTQSPIPIIISLQLPLKVQTLENRVYIMKFQLAKYVSALCSELADLHKL